MLTLLLAIAPALAQDCNPKAAKAALAESSPMGVPVAYSNLAECDEAAAKKAAGAALEKVLPGAEGNQVVLTAIQVGAGPEALDYIKGLQSDERSRAVASLGAACDGSEQVASWLIDTEQALGDRFWTDRWYRSLAECRNPGVQELLQSEVDSPNSDRTRFFGVVEVYARNLGEAAIPTLERLLVELKNEEELTYVVNAFADAAQVGSLNGQDVETTALAVAAIVKAAPQLPPRAVEQARTTLLSLGAEAQANELAGVRYQDRMVDGVLRYGVVVVETATCKKGNVVVGLHMGVLEEGGSAWPDQIEPLVEGASYGWEYELAGGRCKGTSQNQVIITGQPVASDETLQTFWDQHRQATLRAASGDVVEIPETTPLKL